jgi:biotin synthase
VTGGRELHVRSRRPLALRLANSLFLGDYLTSGGQAARADVEMIAYAGFLVLSNRHQPSEDRPAGSRSGGAEALSRPPVGSAIRHEKDRPHGLALAGYGAPSPDVAELIHYLEASA